VYDRRAQPHGGSRRRPVEIEVGEPAPQKEACESGRTAANAIHV